MKKRSILPGFLICFIVLINSLFAQTISRSEAIEDLNQLESILLKESSYLYSKGFEPEKELTILKESLPSEVEVESLYYELMKLIGKIGDRHARVKLPGLPKDSLGLPFVLATLDKKIVVLKKKDEDKQSYQLYHEKFPYLESIQGISADSLVERLAWAYRHAPDNSRHQYFTRSRNMKSLLMMITDYKEGEPLKFELTNGKKSRSFEDEMKEEPQRWNDDNYNPSFKRSEELLTMIEDEIGYISLPMMISKFGSNASFFDSLKVHMNRIKDSKSLIIDIRNNPGGTRDFLMMLAPYFISPEASPWVANVAKIRSDQLISEDMGSMEGRYLFNSRSKHFDDKDREAISSFMATFQAKWDYDQQRFSDYFFLVLSHRLGTDHYYYDKPVYVLVNERSFSAASVFTTALKGMGNIQIAGICTDGSSGRSRKFDLKHSKINLKLSSMISFQRNGTTLDTYGTEPDIRIPKNMDQILGLKDHQLSELVRICREEL